MKTENGTILFTFHSEIKEKDMKKKTGFVMLFFLASIWACIKQNDNGNLYVPTEADTTATASLNDLQQGRSSYISHCGSCHYLYSPDDFSAANWKSIIPTMAPRTNLTSTQVSQVIKYLSRGH